MSSAVNQVMDLLLLRAFRPDPLDPAYTIKSRMARLKSVLVLSVGGTGVVGHRARYKAGQWEILPNEKIEGPYLTAPLLEQGRDMSQSNWVIISFTPANLLCELENGRLPDDAALQKAMLTNPRSILRNHYEQDRRYHLVASGDRKKYLSFSVTSRDAGAIEKMVKDVGMDIGRLQIGLANMAEMAIHRVEAGRKDGSMRMVLVGDQSMILSMAIRDGAWEEPFSFISRSSSGGGGAGDAASVVEYLESLAGEIEEPGVEFHLLHGQNCWWAKHAEKWFEKQGDRFQLKKMEDVSPFIDLQLALDG